MPIDLKEVPRPDGGKPAGRTVKVLVALDLAEPDEECLKRLRGHGLVIDSVIKNIVVGKISSDREAELAGDPQVREVERSAPLKPHQV